MKTKPATNSLVRTVRLEDSRLTALLDRLDADKPSDQNADSTNRTYPYRLKGCVIHVQQPGESSSTAYLVPTREIGARSLSFLHGGFIHVESKVMVQLVGLRGTWENLAGRIVRCQYLENGIHHVCLEFDHLIEPGDYTMDAIRTQVLIVDDEVSSRRLTAFHLKQLNAEVREAEDGRQGVEMAMAEIQDLILMDMDMPVVNGFEATEELRQKGYPGVIVAMTAMTQPADRERCLRAGCNAYIAKPINRDNLSQTLRSLRDEPLLSDFHKDPTMGEILNQFLDELPSTLRELEEALHKEDRAKLQQLTRSIKGTAGGYGYEPISRIATNVEDALIKGGPVSAQASGVQELVKLCLLARSSAKSFVPASKKSQ